VSRSEEHVRVLTSFEELHGVLPGAFSATVGNFDGFHRGHAAVVSELVASAMSRGVPAVAVTFEPHPLAVVGRPERPFVLTPVSEKAALMTGTGLDALLVLEFSREMAATSARDFLAALGAGRLSHLALGYDFRMGRDRACDLRGLAVIASEADGALEVVPPVMHGAEPISSSRIRDALWSGDAGDAAAMLGRPYRLRGRVTPGAGLGARLGYPTANIALPPEKLVPSDGVYRVEVVEGCPGPGLLYVGTRPTFGEGGGRRVEVHVPHGSGAPYGAELAVDVMEFIRPDRAFASAADLKEQIRRDLETAGLADGEGGGGR
jgi:riboflavin kinase / FMN adenylyltransferase